MKALILFFGMLTHTDTIPETIVYTDITKKTVKGYSYIDATGKKVFLSSTKKRLPDNYRIDFPDNVVTDDILPGYGIIIDSLSPHKFVIRIDTAQLKKGL